MGMLRSRCSDELVASFAALAKHRGQTPSALLRSMAEELVLKETGVIDSPSIGFEAKAKTVSTRITQGEAERLGKILAAEQKTASVLLLALIRARLNKAPHFSKDELAALREATRQLQAVGRNLNQVVKAIHAGLVRDPLDGTFIDALRESVKSVGSHVDRLIARNLKRDLL
ncbi:MAG: hypothetical protein GY814_07980 [Gammaproteobacteria bacterium]|nr:hypothetical protein [Gammaproteobacteria bacterium]